MVVVVKVLGGKSGGGECDGVGGLVVVVKVMEG